MWMRKQVVCMIAFEIEAVARFSRGFVFDCLQLGKVLKFRVETPLHRDCLVKLKSREGCTASRLPGRSASGSQKMAAH